MHDYRYFPDPDLLPLEIGEEWKEQIRATLPELPQAKQARYVNELGLSAYDASILTASRAMAGFFEAALAEAPGQAKMCANWMQGEISARLNRENKNITDAPIKPIQLAVLIGRIADGTISNSAAKQIFDHLWTPSVAELIIGDSLEEVTRGIYTLIEAKGLKQVSDSGAIEVLVDEIIAANADKVAEYRSGKDKLFGFFVGLAMKASKGKANPAQLNEILKKKLAG